MGVTNELFPEERSLPPASCLFNPTPEDTTNFPASGAEILSDIVAFSDFMRFLAPAAPSTEGIPGNPSARSIADGQFLFTQVHCSLCHTLTLQTGTSSFGPGLSNQTAALYSDLLVHHMGSGLADNISQGTAGRTSSAPLHCVDWGSVCSFSTMAVLPRPMAVCSRRSRTMLVRRRRPTALSIFFSD
jgi:CxxC motif-containing protein (DUF1111 family)